MALDEAVLVCAPPERFVLRFFRWVGPALTFGYSQPYALAEAAARSRSIPTGQVVRRATGGGIVFHDGDLTFSLVFPWPRLSPPAEIYEKVHRGALSGLLDSGMEASLWASPAGAARLRRAQCFLGPEPSDLVDGCGRKLLGGALRRRLSRGLYQGSLRLSGLDERRTAFEAALAAGLAREWGRLLSCELEPAWIAAAEDLAGKYASEDWNRRR